MESDNYYMHLAIELAKKGKGEVNPNPQVGAIIVKDGRIIGQGYHKKYGEAHAERDALNSCQESPEGATLYVTLEPCAHQGKQPPCFQTIIENKIKQVVIGSFDPNPLVAGKGIAEMEQAGIKVVGPVLEEECREINQLFFHYIKNNTPYVMMKYAMTFDGKIATFTGASKWITGEVARKKVHQDRSRFMGIMVGVGTVLADNPSLTSRGDGLKSPIRIICDSHLRTPLTSEVVLTARETPTLIATTSNDSKKHLPYLENGCEVLVVSSNEGRVDLGDLIKKLGERKIDSVILEGGASLNASALEEGIVQKIQAYIAPKVFGGVAAKSPIGGKGVAFPDQAYQLGRMKTTVLGEDILLESEVL